MIYIVGVIFVIAGGLGMPLAFALGLSAVGGMLAAGLPLTQIPVRIAYSLDSFSLMAIPLFMVAGQLMVYGGIMERLIDFANAVVGRVRGGLAHVTVVTSMGLSSISGTAVADAAALGSTLGPPLTKAYGKSFGAAVVASASTLGPTIPPSAGKIVYVAATQNVSIAALFMAGVVPGIMYALLMMAACSIIAYRRGYPLTGEHFSLSKVFYEVRRSLIVFMMPVVVIGGIAIGAFTATEGAGIAVAYALFIGFFITRKLKISHLPKVLLNAAVITGVVGALIAFASTVTYIFTVEMLAQSLAGLMQSATENPYIFLFFVVVLLLVIGMVMEANAVILMLAPLLAPIADSYGIDPLLFGMVFVTMVTLGGLTPPVGILLFVVSGIWRLSIGKLSMEVLPFLGLFFVVVLSFILYPPIVTAFPKFLGY
ncbi:MAG: TRAP transporter large permease [Hyphomicrobiales bacterium]